MVAPKTLHHGGSETFPPAVLLASLLPTLPMAFKAQPGQSLLGQCDNANQVAVRWPASLQAQASEQHQACFREAEVRRKKTLPASPHLPPLCLRACLAPSGCVGPSCSGAPALRGFAGRTHQGSAGAGGSQMVFFARGKETVSCNCRHAIRLVNLNSSSLERKVTIASP